MNKWYLLIVICTLIISSCALFENFDDLPMFIEIDSVTVDADLSQGTTHHDIIDIWPSADGQSIGVFEIPTRFPVLDEDSETSMFYQAGIKRVGLTDDHIIYPFFSTLIVDRSFAPDSTITENLAFRYRDITKFRFVESFETQHIFVREVDQDSVTSLVIVDDDCAEGNCGLITLTPENPEFAAATSEAFQDVPINNTPVYLEMEYKTEINLSIGLQSNINGTEFEQYFVTLTPNETWKKVYIEMTDIVIASQLESYRILLGALNTLDVPAEVRVDNIKFLHF